MDRTTANTVRRVGLEGRVDPDAGTDAVSSEAHSDAETDVERDRETVGAH